MAGSTPEMRSWKMTWGTSRSSIASRTPSGAAAKTSPRSKSKHSSCSIPPVAECAAVAVPSELGEDDVKVCVVLGPDEAVTPEELVTWLVPRMPSFMVPRYVEYVDSLPRTDATQRIRKTELRQNPLNDSTWDRDAAGIVVPH